jgi:hypothetical protein
MQPISNMAGGQIASIAQQVVAEFPARSERARIDRRDGRAALHWLVEETMTRVHGYYDRSIFVNCVTAALATPTFVRD